jgi:Fur family ferric uptake transcriptional regulator
MTTAEEPLTEEQEVFLKHIQKKGLKRTSQRDLILDVFLRTEDHLSNEDLYQLVKKEDPTVGQTTVYRTLKLLTEAGLAREVRFGDGRAHYEHNYKHQHHDHMICSECGKIIEFFSAELEAIQDAMAAKHHFEITQHLLRIIGICADCQGAKGMGEGPLGACLTPMRAYYSCRAWMSAVTDGCIERAIRMGVRGVGMSAIFPPTPYL